MAHARQNLARPPRGDVHWACVPSKRPPPPSQPGLDEVERALSVLGGRHPEHENIRRETLEAAGHRRHELSKELAASARRKRRRALVIGANAVALAAAGWVAWRLTERFHALRGALDRTEAPWATRGFLESASNDLTARPTLDLDLPGQSCFVAVTTGDGVVQAHLGATSVAAPRSAAWCSCAPGHATIEAPGGGQGPTGLAVMRIDARALGGPLARGWLDFAPGAWAEGGVECADAMLDDWIAATDDGPQPTDGRDLARCARAGLPRPRRIPRRLGVPRRDRSASRKPSPERARSPYPRGPTISRCARPAGRGPSRSATGPIVWCSAAAEPP